MGRRHRPGRDRAPDRGARTRTTHPREEGDGGGPGPSDITWLVDPLDGTSNYAHGLPFACTSVAVRDAEGWRPARSSNRSATSCSPRPGAVARGSASNGWRSPTDAARRARVVAHRASSPTTSPDGGVRPSSRRADDDLPRRALRSARRRSASPTSPPAASTRSSSATPRTPGTSAAGVVDDHRGRRALEDLDGGPLNFGHGFANVLAERADPRRLPTSSQSRAEPCDPCVTSRPNPGLRDQLGATVAEIVSVDQYLEWYPGWKPELTDAPWVRTQPDRSRRRTRTRFWFVDFHWPRGFSPMGMLYVTDCSSWATQTAAHWLPLPSGQGPRPADGRAVLLRVRGSDRPRRGRSASGPPASRRTCPSSSGTSTPSGRSASGSSSSASSTSRATTSRGKSLAEHRPVPHRRPHFHRRAWEIHFELMYPLLGDLPPALRLCASNGIDPATSSKFFQGRDSRSCRPTARMWDLVDRGQAARHRRHVRHRARADPRDSLAKAGGNASMWLTEFDDFL